MARKEINVFNVSFLDLLSGALGAVLILFVVVPKLDSTIRVQLQELETFKELKLEADEIQSMISQLETSVSKDVVTDLKTKFNSLDGNIDKLQSEVKQLQTQLSKSESEKESLEEKVKKMQEQMKSMKEQMKDTNQLAAINKKLRSELDVIKKNQEQVTAQLDNLKLQQNDASAASVKINKQMEDSKKALMNCLESKKKVEDALAEMRAKIEDLMAQNAQLSKNLKKSSSDQDYVEQSVEKMIQKIEQLQKQNESLKKELKNAEKELAQVSKNTGSKVTKTGVQYNSKNVVFVVDVSGSMDDDPEPEKLNEVKAGLKMLIASMDETYKVDIVIYPKSPTQDYDALYNRLVPVTDDQKYAIYRHLSPIFARNCTPTRSVLEHVFTHPAYKDAGTITFLSDGLPTRSVAGSTDCPEDPPSEVLGYVKQLNKGTKTINTIGVGKVYRNKASSDPKVKFMKKLAKDNKGFYIGF